jgi:hypothetical protein
VLTDEDLVQWTMVVEPEDLGKAKTASKVSVIVKNIFQKQNVKISLFWKNGM